jgi:uncharacterized membrane protein
MNRKTNLTLNPLLRSLMALGLVLVLVLGNAHTALAARGGRIGGGSFRAPSPVYRAPQSRTYPGSPYPGGGGFGFPFLIPFLGVGGGFGGLFTLLIFIAIANFLVSSFRRSNDEGDNYGDGYTNPPISLARLQVGLLAEARSLQADLTRIAQTADTGSSEGLSLVLQETTLSLLRHPEYWTYASGDVEQSRLQAAEAHFNRLTLTERSKFEEETLSNVNRQLRQAEQKALPEAEGAQQLLAQAPGEYIVVTLLVAAQGNLKLPAIHSPQELRQALNQLGAVSSEQLLALEVLWTPQAEGDTLTSEDIITAYPHLKLI